MTFEQRLYRRKLRTAIYGVRNYVVLSKPPSSFGMVVTTTPYELISSKETKTIKTKTHTFTKTFLSIEGETTVKVYEDTYKIPMVVKVDKPLYYVLDNISKERIMFEDDFIEIIESMFNEVEQVEQ